MSFPESGNASDFDLVRQCRSYRAHEVSFIDVNRSRDRNELDKIEPTLTDLDLRHIGWRLPKPFSQGALSEAGRTASNDERLNRRLV
jgi:hypothetical protein